MKKILTKVISFAIVLSVLSTCAFADDLTILEGEQFNTFGSLTAEDYGVQSVSWSASFPFSLRYSTGTGTASYMSYTFALSSSDSSDTSSVSSYYLRVICKTGTVVIPAGTLTVSFSSPITAVSTSAGSGVSVSCSGSSLTVVSDGTVSPIPLTITSDYKFPDSAVSTYTVSASFTPDNPVDPDPDPDPVTPPSHTMQGMQNGQRWVLYDRSEWKTYNQYIGFYNTIATGKNTLTDGTNADVEKDLGWVSIDTLAELGYNAYSWTIDPETKALKFSSGALSSSWLDMIWKYQTYNFYWGLQLMTNQTDGSSWFDMISTDFSYLNYRVNQLFEVLSNDEDLEIKNATDEERNWVQDYFTGSGDKADSSKYDDLNNTGSAFKDVFEGAPDTSIADGFTAVNDNGYSFWSQEVSNDINGAGSVSTFSLDPSQQIVDAYSDNWEQIVGGYYD